MNNDRPSPSPERHPTSVPSTTYDAKGPVATTTYGPSAAQPSTAYDHAQPQTTIPSPDHNGFTLEVRAGDLITLGSGVVRVKGILSAIGSTGEGAVYHVENALGEERALKVYPEQRDHRHAPNPRALERIAAILDPDIVRLYDYSTPNTKISDRYGYELVDYARGGTLLDVPTDQFEKKYTESFVREHVLPEIVSGIKCLHAHGIIHCDIKPENILYLDADQTDLVIGDYGSAKTTDGSRDAWRTSVVHGTDAYISPEQSRGLISVKNDWYSLGMVLLRLLAPEFLQRPAFDKLYERQAGNLPVVGDDHPRVRPFADLINGLLLLSPQDRWGQEQIEVYLRGETVISVRRASQDLSAIEVPGKVIRTVPQLAEYLLAPNSPWYDELIVDQSALPLYGWAHQVQGTAGQKELHSQVQQAQKERREWRHEYVRQAILRFFDPSTPIVIGQRHFDFWNSSALQDELTRAIAYIDDLYLIERNRPDKSLIEWIRAMLTQVEQTLRSIIRDERHPNRTIATNLLANMREGTHATGNADQNLSADLDESRWLELAWAMTPNRGLRWEKEDTAHTADDALKKIRQTPTICENPNIRAEIVTWANKVGGTAGAEEAASAVHKTEQLQRLMYQFGARTLVLDATTSVTTVRQLQDRVLDNNNWPTILAAFRHKWLDTWLANLPDTAAIRDRLSRLRAATDGKDDDTPRMRTGIRAALCDHVGLQLEGGPGIQTPMDLVPLLRSGGMDAERVRRSCEEGSFNIWLQVKGDPESLRLHENLTRTSKQYGSSSGATLEMLLLWMLDSSAPYVFKNKAYLTPDTLAQILDKTIVTDPDIANLLADDRVVAWLDIRGDTQRATDLRALRGDKHLSPAARHERLLQLLHPKIGKPKLVVSGNSSRRIIIPLDTRQATTSIALENTGRGHLYGTARIASASGSASATLLSPTIEGDTTLEITLNAKNTDSGDVIEFTIELDTSGGKQTVTLLAGVGIPWLRVLPTAVMAGGISAFVFAVIRAVIGTSIAPHLLKFQGPFPEALGDVWVAIPMFLLVVGILYSLIVVISKTQQQK